MGKLVELDERDLKAMGFRPPQVDEIRLVLHRKGLALRGEVLDVRAA